MQFREITLPNDLTIIAEENPSAQSVAAGFFVMTGARDETPEINGVSHFLEHMAFKGSAAFTADDINRVFDEVGAKYNASTGEEVTLFYAAILPEYTARTFEVLSSLLFPALRQADFDVEKNVILEEIGMYQDQPTFIAHEALMRTHFAGHPLEQSILGTPESIRALTSEQMRGYHSLRYKAGNIVLAVAGNGDWNEILRLAEKHCGSWPAGKELRNLPEAHPTGGTHVITRENSVQQHVMQMMPAPAADSPMRFAAELLAVIIGDDSGSRLYWELVDPGLAEAAELAFNDFEGTGAWMTYLSCSPDAAEKNIARIGALYKAVNCDLVTEAEMNQAKSKVASRIVLRGERPMGRLASLGGNWVYRQEYRSIEDDLATIKSLTAADIRELLDVYPLGQMTTSTIGPLVALPGCA